MKAFGGVTKQRYLYISLLSTIKLLRTRTSHFCAHKSPISMHTKDEEKLIIIMVIKMILILTS